VPRRIEVCSPLDELGEEGGRVEHERGRKEGWFLGLLRSLHEGVLNFAITWIIVVVVLIIITLTTLAK
jgi:hypothetical protein